MKNINDTKLYFYFTIITLAIAILLGFIFLYSRIFVESEINKLLSSEDNINENYKKAYIRLKNPHIFARYQNFDDEAAPIENIIKRYDEKMEKDETFEENDKKYLLKLLERRELGSVLTRNTMIFFFLLTLLGLIFCLFEIRSVKKVKKDG